MIKPRTGRKSRLLKCLILCLFTISSIFPAFAVNAAMDASASPLSDTQIQLQWSWPMGAVTCSIYRNESTAPIKIVNINTDSNYTSFTDSGLTPETQYSYRLEMKNSANAILDKAEVTAKTLTVSKPVISSAVFNVNAETENEHTITLKWKNGSASAVGAVIKRSDGTELAVLDNVSQYTSGDMVTYSFKDKVTSYGQELQYTITSKDSQGRRSQPSSPVSVIPIKPPEISAVMASGVVTISWPDKTGIENFQLERSKYDGTTWGNWISVNATIPAGTATVTDNLTAAGTYRYRMSAIPTGKYGGTGNISNPIERLTAPANLVCTYTNTGKVSLTWTNDANNKGLIKVEKGTDSGSFTEIATLARNVTSYTDMETLAPGRTYYYRIAAYDSDNNKAVSNIASFSLSEPAAPAGLKVIVVSNRNLRLSWEDKSSNETSFKIERKIGSGSYSEIATTGANVTQYSDTGVFPDTVYTYRVFANNSFGNSATYSNEVTVTASSVSAPESLTVKAVSPTQIDLAWTSSGAGSQKMFIERKLAAEETWSVIAEVASDIRSYSDTGLKENTLYAYRIRAIVSANVYSEYFPSSFQSYGAYTKLAAPDGLTAVVTEYSAIALAWNDHSSETNFIIEKKAGSSSSYYVVVSLPADTKSWTDNDTEPGKTYRYRIQARTSENESDYSTELTITATRIGVPTALAVNEGDDGSVKLTWHDNSDNESGFEIWRMAGSAGTWEKHGTVASNINSYTDTKIESDVPYYYKVRAYISTNSAVSGFSNEVSIVVQLLQAPSDVKAEAVSDTQIRLTWVDNLTGETGFSIERKKQGGTYAEVGRVGANLTNYLDKELEPNTRYYYRVKAYDENKSSEYTQEVYANTKAKVVFSDLASVSWARDAIENMAARGMINGIGGGKYAPLEEITRAQFVSILIRAFNLGDYTASSEFSDVKEGKWYYKELMAAKALGIIASADDTGNFYPEKPIIREDIAVIIGNTLSVVNKQLENADIGILDDFTDWESVSEDALQSMANVYKAEIMVGNGNGTLTPKSTASRAQAAVIIYRIIDR